jgi:hypothetical protein
MENEMELLSQPKVVESYLDNTFQPPVPALRLRWDVDSAAMAERSWYLPQHLTLKGPAPVRFGLSLVRVASDAYDVRLLWNEMCLSWAGLTRVQLLTSALSPVLRVLGQDLWHLLNQPIQSVVVHPGKVA